MNSKGKLSIILFFIVFLVYGVSLGNQFLWDDEEAIVQNQLIHSLSNLPKFWTGGIFNSYGANLSGGFYRPVTTTVMASLWAISHDPWIFRLLQVSLHAASAVLLFFFLQRWFRPLPSFLGSAIFAVHPGISEAVLWISTIADPLMAVFLLTSLLLTPKHIKTAAFLFLLALLTKEAALVFLPLFFLLRGNKYCQSTHGRESNNNITIHNEASGRSLALWLGSATAIYGLLRFLAVGTGVSSLAFPAPIAQAGLMQRLLTIPAEIAYYLKLFLWPFPLSISRHFVIASPADGRLWGSLLVLIPAVILIMRYRRRPIVFFSLWFFLSILPYLQFIPLSATVADRWLYLPSIGLIGLVLLGLEQLPLRAPMTVLSTVVLIFSILTIQRSLQWRSGLILFSHDVSVNPRSFDLQNNYGVELFRTGVVDQAKGAFERSITLNPHWWVPLNNLGAVVEREGNVAGAKSLYEQSIQAGDYYLAYENLAKLLLFRENALQEARDLSGKALKAFPASVNLWMVAAIASYQLGNRDGALAAARQLFAIAPTPEAATLLSRIANNLPLEPSKP